MADEETVTREAPSEPTVPKDRFDKVLERAKAAEAQAGEFQKRLEALEDAGKSDVERLTKELERAQAERESASKEKADLERRVTRSERSSLVREAAVKANIVDADAAIAFADLDAIEDAAGAKKFAERLARDKPYLVTKQSDGPSLQKVFGPGGAKADPADLTAEQRDAFVKRQQGESLLALIDKSRVQAGLDPIAASDE